MEAEQDRSYLCFKVRLARERNGDYCRPFLFLDPWVKYGVRSPKFIWAPCVKLHSLAETPQPPSSLPFWLIYEGVIGHPR
jgi:hypothetical protein